MKTAKRLSLLIAVLFLLAGITPTLSYARVSHSSGQHLTRISSPSSAARDSHGHIKRSAAAKNHFIKINPCPSTGKTSGSCSGEGNRTLGESIHAL